jgi:DNA-dependent RNA polymerase auxiliary subunit epsilon
MTTTTFADYAAASEVRKDIELAVMGYTLQLCEALRQNFIDYSIKSHQYQLTKYGGDRCDVSYAPYHEESIDKLRKGICDYEFYPETGRKYHKIIMSANGSRSVHAFIDKKTGQIYKSASWKAPAKGVRYDLRLIKDREWLLENADWAGSYLYAK